MSLAFTVSQVMQGLQALQSIVQIQDISQALGPARPFVQYYPETAAHLRAIELGLGDPEANLRALQAKSDFVRDAVRDHYGNGTHSFRELVELIHDPLYRPQTILHDVLLPAGFPNLLSSDVPILLGALIIFFDGGGAEIRWSDELSINPQLGPLMSHYNLIHPDTLSSTQLHASRQLPPINWEEAVSLFQGFRTYPFARHSGAQSFFSDGQNFGWLRLDVGQTQLESHVETEGQQISHSQFSYLGPHRTYQRTELVASTGQLADLSRLDITLYGETPKNTRLDPRVPQFFYGPGVVYELIGMSNEVEAFPIQFFSQMIRALRTSQQGKSAEWPPFFDSLDEVRTDGELSYKVNFQTLSVNVKLDASHDSGLPYEWQIWTEDDPNVNARVTAFPVRDDTVDALQEYIGQRRIEGLQLNHANNHGVGSGPKN